MSAPVSGADTRPLFTGDNTDDDAAVVDSYLIETDAPPTPVIQAINPEPLIHPVPATILRTGTVELRAAYTPIQLMVADTKRQSLQLSGYSSASPVVIGDYALIAFDPGLLTPTAAYRLRHGQTFSLDDHTGEVWVLINPGATAATVFEVSFVAATH